MLSYIEIFGVNLNFKRGDIKNKGEQKMKKIPHVLLAIVLIVSILPFGVVTADNDAVVLVYNKETATIYKSGDDTAVTDTKYYKDDYIVFPYGSQVQGKGRYIKQTVTIPADGYYGVVANCSKSSASELSLEVCSSTATGFTGRAMPVTDGYEDVSLGYIYLTAGEQDITVKSIGKKDSGVTINLKTITLTKDAFVDDFSENEVEVSAGAHALVDQAKVYEDGESAYYNRVFLRASTYYVTVGMYAEKAGTYEVFMYGRSYSGNAKTVQLTHNDSTAKTTTVNTESDCFYTSFGMFRLKRGFNTFKVNNISSGITELRNLKFVLRSDIKDNGYTALATDADVKSSGVTAGESTLTMPAGSYVEYDIYNEIDGVISNALLNANVIEDANIKVYFDDEVLIDSTLSAGEKKDAVISEGVELPAGRIKLKIEIASGSVELESLNFNIPEPPIELSGTIPLNKNKTMYLNTTGEEVTTSGDYGDDYVILRGGASIYDKGGQYLTQIVNVKEAGCYGVTASYARSGTNLWAIEVMAQSTGKFTSRQLPTTGSDTTYKSASLGYIYLEKGIQSIRIKGVASGIGRVASVTFTKDVFTEDLTEDVTTITTGAGNLVDQNKVYTASQSGYDHTSYLRGSDRYVTVGIYTDYAGKYDLSVTYGIWSGYGSIQVWVNGVMEQQPSIKGNKSEVKEYFIDTVTLKKGINEIKIQGSNYISLIKNIVLRRGLEQTSLAIENADGERMPYTVAYGVTAYASATLSKTENSPEKYFLAIAQYSDVTNVMEKVEIEEIDMSEETLNSSKKVRLPLTMTGSGGYVKAFLWDGISYEPLLAAESYEDKVEDVFSPEFLKSLLSETKIGYVEAESLTDADGNAYTGYELHDDSYDIDGIFYDGSEYDGKIFAYIGIPKNASESNKVPAVVLVHGGEGTAFRKWVKLWNDRGYAAIAMDLNGSVPQPDSDSESKPVSGRHPYAGESWSSTWGSEVSAKMYNNAIDIIKAHTLISNHPYVDETKTAITGVSWGGIRTNIVMGLDDRFEAAVPVYGTGYLDKSHTYFGGEVTFGEESIYMDPANFAARAKMPVMMVCSDTDVHFSINTNSLTASVIPNSILSIKHKWSHSHSYAWKNEQIYDFISEVLENGKADDIEIISSTAKGNRLSAEITIPAGRSIDSATMYYLSGGMAYGGDQIWTLVDTYQYSDGTLTFEIPDDAKYCYASLKDDRGHIISTKYMRIEK